MPQKPKIFHCPSCGQLRDALFSHALRGTVPVGEHHRRYRCSGCGATFTTVETTLEAPPGIEDLRVRGAGQGEGGYSQETLIRALVSNVPKGLRSSEIRDIVRAVEDGLDRDIKRRAIAFKEKRGQLLFHLQDTEVDDRVLGVFRTFGQLPSAGDQQERYRAAHVKFALGRLGTRNPRGRWRTARDVIDWMRVNCDTDAIDTPVLADDQDPPRGVIRWFPPPAEPPPIHTVIKNYRPPDDEADDEVKDAEATDLTAANPLGGRPRVPFKASSLTAKLSIALAGRAPDRTPALATKWILWGLAGQQVVRSSQLSAAAAEVLRCLDDVAYLRWVAVGKELGSEEILREAIALIEFPSPRLEFDPAAGHLVRGPMALGGGPTGAFV